MPEHLHSTARIQAVSLFANLIPCNRLRVSIQCLLLPWGILFKERLKVLGPHEAVLRGGINQFLEAIPLDKILHHSGGRLVAETIMPRAWFMECIPDCQGR